MSQDIDLREKVAELEALLADVDRLVAERMPQRLARSLHHIRNGCLQRHEARKKRRHAMTTPTEPDTSSGDALSATEARPDAYPIVSFPIEDAPAWARSGDGDGEVAVVYIRVESEHFTQKQCWHLSRTNAVALRDALAAYLETPTKPTTSSGDTPTEVDAKLSGEAGRPCCDVDGCSEPAAVDDRGFRLHGQPYFAAYCREHANAMDASIREDPTP